MHQSPSFTRCIGMKSVRQWRSRSRAVIVVGLWATTIQSGHATTGAPQIIGRTALSAMPAELSDGASGPVNRIAIDTRNFAPNDPAASLTCHYPRLPVYRCDYEFVSTASAGTQRRRVVVSVPDIDRGTRVIVRLTNAHGHEDLTFDIVNGTQVAHEIESVMLPSGGRTGKNSKGETAPLTQLATVRASTVPAVAATAGDAEKDCNRSRPYWVGASATDPVFTSQFGALDGAVTLAQPPRTGSAVRSDNLPVWLITFPLSATRAQFIAHYQFTYRVGVCADKVARA